MALPADSANTKNASGGQTAASLKAHAAKVQIVGSPKP